MKKLIVLIIVLFSAAGLALAQDTIVKKNGDVLKVKITEIGTEEIKFKASAAPDAPVIVIKKSEVKKVVVSGQVIIDEKDEPKPKDDKEDVLVKTDGTTLKVKVIEIGTNEVKFRLFSDPDGPVISIAREDIRTLKVGDQVVIDNKKDPEDLIVKMDGSSLKVKVIEMGSDEVSFKLYNNPDGPVMSLKKKEIKQVKIDGQIVYEYKPDPYSTSNQTIINKTSNAKFHFFSPLFNYVAFSYEWMNRPGFNYEAGFGIIGIGVTGNSNASNAIYGVRKTRPRGFYVRGGPKFLLGNSSDIEVEGGRIAHPLKGRYFQIEAMLHAMSANYALDTGYTGPSGGGMGTINWQKKYQSLVINLIYGRQNIYGNAITIGYYIGFGYALESTRTIGNTPANTGYYDYFDVRRFSHTYFGKDFPLTFTWGFTIGFIHPPPVQKGDKSYKNNPRSGKG
ncbi:MAG: hypothetical protein AB1458_11295 [Bacteroidota bacterium]